MLQRPMIRGACIIIEQSLGRPLLWLACWYHIHEVVLKNTYELLFGPSQVLRFLCSSDSEEDLSLVYLGGWSGDPPRFNRGGSPLHPPRDCSIMMHAPLIMPLLDAVISKERAMILSAI